MQYGLKLQHVAGSDDSQVRWTVEDRLRPLHDCPWQQQSTNAPPLQLQQTDMQTSNAPQQPRATATAVHLSKATTVQVTAAAPQDQFNVLPASNDQQATTATPVPTLTTQRQQPDNNTIVIDDSQPSPHQPGTMKPGQVSASVFGEYYGIGTNSSGGGLPVLCRDMDRLTKQYDNTGDNISAIKINDELVNIYMDLLMKQHYQRATPGQSRHFVCSSFFMSRLLSWWV
jgi:hypothetical protein